MGFLRVGGGKALGGFGFHDDDGADAAGIGIEVGKGGESGSPGDVAVAGGVVSVATFGENPAGAGVNFPEREEVCRDVRMSLGEMLLSGGELIHKGEAEVLLF